METLTTVKPELLVKLRCPRCRSALRAGTGAELCCELDHRFPIVEGVPCFLPDSMLPPSLEERGLAAFDRRGPINSWAMNHWEDLGLGALLGPPENGNTDILCFGGGDRRERQKLREQGYEVVSFDIDPIDGVDLLADGHALPFADATFDVVTAWEVLEHLPQPWIAIQEISRILRPGGRFVGSVAFMKPFHSSFFHMSHKGVQVLAEGAGLELERVYGGQNVLVTTVGNLAPLGPARISRKIYSLLYALTLRLRAQAFRMRRGDPSAVTAKYGSAPSFSFDQYDRLVFAGAVIFSSRKPPGITQ